MATTINKTDGSVLTTIADGAVDLSSTNIALIGRLYRNYGELVNENLVKMLENFANTSSPSTPIVGQLWYDKSNKKINVYRDTGFVGLGVVTNSNAEPNNPQLGDLWYDTADAQLKLWTGSKWEVMAPQYTSGQGKSGVFVENITDTLDNNHIAVLVYQQNNVISIFSKDSAYTPKTAISGFTAVNTGFNVSSIGKLHGIATNSELLDGISSESFLRSDANDTATGTINLVNDTPLVLGADGDLTLGASGSNFVFTKNNAGSFRFVVDGTENAVEINDDQQLTLADGNATFPSLSFTGDKNTGMYRIGENAIGFSTDGNLKFTIGSSTVTSNVDFNASGQTISSATGTFATVNATGQLVTSLISSSDIVMNGNVSVTGNNTISGNNIVTGNGSITGTLNVSGVTTINNDTTINGTLTLNGASIIAPSGLGITGSTGIFGEAIITGNLIITGSSVTNLDLLVDQDLFVTKELLIQYNSVTGTSGLRVDTSGRILINTTGPANAANLPGDITLGDGNVIYAYNTAKYWAVWSDNSSTPVFLDGHNVDSVERTATGRYKINLSYNMNIDFYHSVIGMGAYGWMQLANFALGADYVEVYNQIIDNSSYQYTNGSSYNSVVIHGG